jgi:hypothetical protein
MDQTFFGFKPEDQVKLHERLFELLMAGDGRWDWDTIYNLPIYLRRFWITKINQSRYAVAESEQEAAERAKIKHEQRKRSR